MKRALIAIALLTVSREVAARPCREKLSAADTEKVYAFVVSSARYEEQLLRAADKAEMARRLEARIGVEDERAKLGYGTLGDGTLASLVLRLRDDRCPTPGALWSAAIAGVIAPDDEWPPELAGKPRGPGLLVCGGDRRWWRLWEPDPPSAAHPLRAAQLESLVVYAALRGQSTLELVTVDQNEFKGDVTYQHDLWRIDLGSGEVRKRGLSSVDDVVLDAKTISFARLWRASRDEDTRRRDARFNLQQRCLAMKDFKESSE